MIMENEKQVSTNWYELDVQTVLEKLDVKPGVGLSKEQVSGRQACMGKNVLQPPKKAGLIQKILHQLKDVSIIVLLIAVALSFLMAFNNGEGIVESFVILAVVVLNVILAITHEGRAEKALEALAKLNSPICVVMRDGVKQNIDTDELVPGDIIILETGNIVPADARLLEATGFFSDESALTGESEPAEKDAAITLSGNMSLGDQHNMIFTGCVVTAGRGTAVVTSTGMHTQMGQIAGFLRGSKLVKTPLQLRLDQLGKTICSIALISAFILMAIGLYGGAPFGHMLLIAISLAVAAVPETLSLIVTLSMTNGVQKMVKKHALIRKLPAVETLGNTSVICSDKTGTLTQNRMAVKQLWVCGGKPFADDVEFSEEQNFFLKRLAMVGNAAFEIDENGDKVYMGNATEIGILRLLNEKGYTVDKATHEYPRVAEIPFSSDRKKMSVILRDRESGGYIVLTKGALDRLLISSESASDLEDAQRVHDELAAKALRVIALAGKYVDTLPEDGNLAELEQDLKLHGLVGLIDPPRPEAAIAIAKAKHAGIRTVMITGDHAATAGAIAKDLGILEEGKQVLTGAQLAEISDTELNDTVKDFAVYARVTPEDKLRIVKAWQSHGDVVAMTGDGVNDAPALKVADIGIAMGKTGTEVAKTASDMVLVDDNFATIVEAVGEGRCVYESIKKTITFLLVCNMSEIIVMLYAQMAGWGILLTPVMLLLINLLGDGIPGINLAREESDPALMDNKPIRRNESFFKGDVLRVIIQQTIFCSIVVLIGYYIGASYTLYGTPASAGVGQMLAFLITSWTSVIHVFHVRSSKSVFKTPIKNNKPLVMGAILMLFVLAALVISPFNQIFGPDLSVIKLHGIHWIIAIVLSIVPTIMREICLLLNKLPIIEKHHDKINDLFAKIQKYITKIQVYLTKIQKHLLKIPKFIITKIRSKNNNDTPTTPIN